MRAVQKVRSHIFCISFFLGNTETNYQGKNGQGGLYDHTVKI